MISNIVQTLYIRFTVISNFLNCTSFRTFWILRSYVEHSLSHHFKDCAHCVYEIYSVFKIFQMAVRFPPVSSYGISTPVIQTMLTMVKFVQIITSHIDNYVYIKFTVFSNVSEFLFVLNILAFTKFLLRWCAPRYVKDSLNHPFRPCAHFVSEI